MTKHEATESDAPVEQPEIVTEPTGSERPRDADQTIESPAKIIRVGAMVKQMLEEVRLAPMDESARDHLRDIYRQSIEELKGALSPDLADELERLAPDFDGAEPPTESSLRIAQAQLVGWLEGLFHGIQATLMAQQMSVRQPVDGRSQLAVSGGPEQGQASGVASAGPAGYL